VDPVTAVEAEKADDRALAEALIAGRPEAFEPFVERFGPLIRNFGRRMCGHRDDADEVLEETLLTAYLSLKDLHDPSALRAWVFRVAANACLKMRRQDRLGAQREIGLEEILPGPGDGGGPPQIPDWSQTPLDRLLQDELRGKLDESILGLPSDYRIVLLLRDQEGFSTRQTADMLGISETLAKVRLHRARLALRKSLEGYLKGVSA
jgi:RNA polymerase sigma-70 factor (ECF subfamily)